MRKLFSLLMAVLLLAQLPLTAFAKTYYLSDGSIYISAESGRGQVVQQGDSGWEEDDAPIITGTSTTNTITVTTNGADANVTLQNVDISSSGAAMIVNRAEGTTVTVELDGENSLTSGAQNAGLQTMGDGTLVIEDANGDGGSLTAQGGSNGGAGIGGASGENGENITINGGDITAYAGSYEYEWQGSGAAGIGGGNAGDGNNIIINDGTVDAFGCCFAAGIGGGTNGDANNIQINGGSVTADGGNAGAGIGGGGGGYANNISVSGDANVTAIGSYGAANIGNGTMISGAVVPEEQEELLDEEGNWKDNVDTSGLYNTGSVTLGSGEEATTIVGVIPDPDAPVVSTGHTGYLYGGEGSWSQTSHIVDDEFWQDVVAQLRAAEKGKAVLIDVGDRKVMPAYVMEAVRETGVILIIQWDGGDDIIIEEAYPYKDAYEIYWLMNLNRILASVK